MSTSTGVISNYLEDKLVHQLITYQPGQKVFTPPTQMYMALYTNTLGAEDTDSGTEMTSSVLTNYSRASITPSTDFEISDNLIYNKESISFDAAAQAWVTVYGWGIRDSETSGNLLFSGLFDSSVSIPAGESLRIPPESLEIRFLNTSATSGGWTLFSACQVWSWMLKGTSFGWSSSGMNIALGTSVVLADTNYNLFSSWAEISTIGTDYSRKQILSSAWGYPTTGKFQNTNVISFSEQATADWGVVSDVVLYNITGESHPLFWAHLSTPVTVNDGDGFKIAAGGLQLQFD